VHDEIVIECASEAAEFVAEHLHEVMCTAPDWAQGFPLNAEVKVMERYGKG
jgi:DNA polymerase I-like protein with 3'-5' exonuclease and polymerase domains